MSKLDEKALRRPEFTEGHKVVLADGQEWTFPRPMTRFFPAKGEDGRVLMAGDRTHGDQYEALRDELLETAAEDAYNLTRIQLEIAGLLLLLNYDLDDKQLRRLVPYIPSDDANQEMWDGLVPILMAAPQRSFPNGSDAP